MRPYLQGTTKYLQEKVVLCPGPPCGFSAAAQQLQRPETETHCHCIETGVDSEVGEK